MAFKETTGYPVTTYSMSYEYDLAISFAGEQRGLADTLARRLDAAGYAIFYDEFKQAEPDLVDHYIEVATDS